jgi:hypothetical protein
VRSRASSATRNGWIEQMKTGRGQATVRLTARGSDVAADASITGGNGPDWKGVARKATL